LNGEFLDVKARFAHEFINHPDRLKTPMIRYTKGGKLIPATWDAAIRYVGDKLKGVGSSIGVIASPRLTNESVFTLKRFASEVAKSDSFAVSDRYDLSAVFDNLSAPLATHKDIRNASTILLIGGEPEEEQTFIAKQIRQAVRNGGAKFIVVNETPTRLTAQASQFIHVNKGSYDAFALVLADAATDDVVKKLGIEMSDVETLSRTLGETEGDLIILIGGDLSHEAQAAIAASAANFGSETHRVSVIPLAPYNNSVGANDMAGAKKAVVDVINSSRAVLVGGSINAHDSTGFPPKLLESKDFVVVQELFETETTQYADVVFPAASFAEMDGTYTNNTGFVQRVRKAIEPIHQSKPDWMITSMIAKEMGVDFGYNMAATAVFKKIGESVPAYAGIRYPDLKDESRPVQVKRQIVTGDAGSSLDALKRRARLAPAARQAEIAQVEERHDPDCPDSKPGQHRIDHVQQVRHQSDVGEETGFAQHQGLGAGRREQAHGNEQRQQGAELAMALEDGEHHGEIERQDRIERHEQQDLRVLAQRHVQARGDQRDQKRQRQRRQRDGVRRAVAGMQLGRTVGRAAQGKQGRSSTGSTNVRAQTLRIGRSGSPALR
jgi:NADH dehydrogenase/NADH:ubiquinone oxidoreductase subunit G